MNNTAYQKNLSALLGRFGNHSNVALFMDVLPRTFRDQRRNPNRKAARRVAMAAKLIRLRAFINLLRTQYNVSDQDARTLMQQVNSTLEQSAPRSDM